MGSGQSNARVIEDLQEIPKKSAQHNIPTISLKHLSTLPVVREKSVTLAIKEEEKKMVSLFGKLYRFHASTGSLEDLGYDDTKNQITLIGGYQEEQEKSIMEVSLKEEEDIRSDSNDIRSESFEFTNPKVLVDMIRKISRLDYEDDKEMPLPIQTMKDSFRWGSSSSIVMKNFDFASQHGVVSSRDSSASGKKSNLGKGISALKRHQTYRRPQPQPPMLMVTRSRSYSLSHDLIKSINMKNNILDEVTEPLNPLL